MVRLAGIDLAHADKYYAFAGNVLRSLVRLFMSIMIARLAGADGYGGYVLLVAIEVIAVAVMSSLVGAPLLTMAPGCSSARSGNRPEAAQALRTPAVPSVEPPSTITTSSGGRV